jgi:uncharacterized OB-fold protein
MDTSSMRLPDVTDPLTAPFWAGTSAGEIRVQQCEACGYLRWPPAPVCPECLAPPARWTRLRGQGTVLSYCVYHRALAPAFKDELPYAVACVELAEGPRMYGQFDGPPQRVNVGQLVRAVFRQLSPEVTVIKWAEGTPEHEE